MATTNKHSKPKRDKLQEIADRYGVMIYVTKEMAYGVGLVRHDGYDCQRVTEAVRKAARQC